MKIISVQMGGRGPRHPHAVWDPSPAPTVLLSHPPPASVFPHCRWCWRGLLSLTCTCASRQGASLCFWTVYTVISAAAPASCASVPSLWVCWRICWDFQAEIIFFLCPQALPRHGKAWRCYRWAEMEGMQQNGWDTWAGRVHARRAAGISGWEHCALRLRSASEASQEPAGRASRGNTSVSDFQRRRGSSGRAGPPWGSLQWVGSAKARLIHSPSPSEPARCRTHPIASERPRALCSESVCRTVKDGVVQPRSLWTNRPGRWRVGRGYLQNLE